jgi:hypothetical protein
MPKRAKLLIAFSVMLYGAFLAEKIALATGFSLVAGVSIAFTVFLASAGLFLALVRLFAFLAERQNSRWFRPHASILLVASILVCIGATSVVLQCEKMSRDRKESDVLAEQERKLAAWAERKGEFQPITDSGGDVYFDCEMDGEDVWGMWQRGTPEPNASGQVQFVFFQGATVTDAAMDCIATLPELKRLDLRAVRISDSNLRRLKGLSSLKYLFLEKTPINDDNLEFLDGLAGLVLLDLSGTNVSDKGLEYLPKNLALRFLNLGHTQVTDAGVAELQKALPNCTIER